MQYFTELASSHREALDVIRAKYGDSAQVLSHKTVRMGGFFGLFAREGVEVTGYIRPERAAEAKSAPKPDFEEEKRKILAQAKADQALQQVLAEIKGIRDRLDERPAAATEADDPRRYAASTLSSPSTISPNPSGGRRSPASAGTSRSRPWATSRKSSPPPWNGWEIRFDCGPGRRNSLLKGRRPIGGGPGSSPSSGRRGWARPRR